MDVDDGLRFREEIVRLESVALSCFCIRPDTCFEVVDVEDSVMYKYPSSWRWCV